MGKWLKLKWFDLWNWNTNSMLIDWGLMQSSIVLIEICENNEVWVVQHVVELLVVLIIDDQMDYPNVLSWTFWIGNLHRWIGAVRIGTKVSTDFIEMLLLLNSFIWIVLFDFFEKSQENVRLAWLYTFWYWMVNFRQIGFKSNSIKTD